PAPAGPNAARRAAGWARPARRRWPARPTVSRHEDAPPAPALPAHPTAATRNRLPPRAPAGRSTGWFATQNPAPPRCRTLRGAGRRSAIRSLWLRPLTVLSLALFDQG